LDELLELEFDDRWELEFEELFELELDDRLELEFDELFELEFEELLELELDELFELEFPANWMSSSALFTVVLACAGRSSSAPVAPTGGV
jgi:hypothetical protein